MPRRTDIFLTRDLPAYESDPVCGGGTTRIEVMYSPSAVDSVEVHKDGRMDVTSTRQTPKPGIYFGIDFAEYLKWDAVSHSRLNLMNKSALHYQTGFREQPTNAMRIGSLMHCGVLEPLHLGKRYAVMPDFAGDVRNVTKNGEPSKSTSTDWYKNSVAEWRRVNADKIEVSQNEFDELFGVCKAVKDNLRASEWLSRGQAEVSLCWRDVESGLLCKARCDWLNIDDGYFVDLKTTPDALRFERAIAKWNYHQQMAWYQHGLLELTGKKLSANIVAVETDKPFGCRAAPMSELYLEAGRNQFTECMEKLIMAHTTGKWPCYDNPAEWECPSYLVQDIELIIGGESLTA